MFFTYAFVSSAKENTCKISKKQTNKQTNKARSTSAADPWHLKI